MTQSKISSNTSSATTATCPACGLLCDDIDNNLFNTNKCEKSVAFFSQKSVDASPQIAGNPSTLAEAVARATEILKKSKQPLLSGLSTDVAGFRAVFELAQKTHGTLKHMNAASSQRNLNVLQSTGWQTTTLTEVKNRADLIVCIGTDVVSHNPRFFERNVDCDGMFISAKNRQLIFVGNAPSNDHIKSNALKAAWVLPCSADDLPSATGALRALVQNKPLNTPNIGGISLADLTTLADKLKQAKYAVMVWIAKDLDFKFADLTIQNITQTVAALNETTRAGGLALGGSDGDTSANYANTWLSGYALNDSEAAHDAVVFINSFSPSKAAPKTNLPLIVLGNCNLQFADQIPDVFIPIATPGLDCSGTLFRVDSSVVLPLKKLHENELPLLADVAKQIEALL
jgi:formylmethanofuran dehydrogenase subunit B